MYSRIQETTHFDYARESAERGDFFECVDYHVIKQLGRGGMGNVYLASDRNSDALCALKVVRNDGVQNEQLVSRLSCESEMLSRLSHPNIVRPIRTIFRNENHHVLAMEYLSGKDLDAFVRSKGRMKWRRVVRILRQLCSALEKVHADGFVHNDIKPSNIMWSRRKGACGTAKLIDFGLARRLGESKPDKDSDDCTFSGSPLFASPESCGGIVDARSDAYSLAATAYFLLTGRPVFDEERALAAIAAHATLQPTSMRELVDDVPAELDAIILKCLEKNPDDRFQTMKELEKALARIQGQARRKLGRAMKASQQSNCRFRYSPWIIH